MGTSRTFLGNCDVTRGARFGSLAVEVRWVGETERARKALMLTLEQLNIAHDDDAGERASTLNQVPTWQNQVSDKMTPHSLIT